MVARDTLMAFDEPSDLASTSWTPAASRIARAAPPAMTPVPGAAGFSSTRAASCSPMIVWVIVSPASGTANRRLRASSMPFWIAAGTSLALPYPRPTLPAPSPTTTSAVKEKRRPPLTTLATRLMAITRSSYWPSAMSVLFLNSEREPGFAGAIGDRGHAAVVPEAAAVEHDRLDSCTLGALTQERADLLGGVDGGAGAGEGLLGGGRRRER